MNLVSWLYLTDILHSFDCFLGIVIFTTIVLFCISIVTFINLDNSKEDEQVEQIILKSYKKWWVFALIVILDLFIPSQKTMYLMLGSSFLSQSNLPSKVSQVLELKLDDIIKDLTDKKKDKE